MIVCLLDVSVDLKHPLDILIDYFKIYSRLSSSILVVVFYTLHPYLILDLINDR